MHLLQLFAHISWMVFPLFQESGCMTLYMINILAYNQG